MSHKLVSKATKAQRPTLALSVSIPTTYICDECTWGSDGLDLVILTKDGSEQRHVPYPQLLLATKQSDGRYCVIHMQPTTTAHFPAVEHTTMLKRGYPIVKARNQAGQVVFFSQKHTVVLDESTPIKKR